MELFSAALSISPRIIHPRLLSLSHYLGWKPLRDRDKHQDRKHMYGINVVTFFSFLSYAMFGGAGYSAANCLLKTRHVTTLGCGGIFC